MRIRSCSRPTRAIFLTVIQNQRAQIPRQVQAQVTASAPEPVAASGRVKAADTVQAVAVTPAAETGMKVAVAQAAGGVGLITIVASTAGMSHKKRASWRSPSRPTPKQRERIRLLARLF